MEEKWLANLSKLAKNEETAEHEYHTLLNKDVRKEKMIYSSYLLESQKSKHQINREEEATITKRQKDLTNVSLEDDDKSNTTNVAYSGKSMDDLLPGDQVQDSSSVLVKKDLVKLAEFQAGALDELTKKFGNRIGIISFGIWICGEHIRVYEMDLNYDGIYRMILIADVCVPIEREKIVGLLPVLEAFYNVKVSG
ncbi:6517_t:CDS:2 [Paraglomus brasilianum]|uniref:6517_t:CDS:1 n=1 Tax=Paraglomus brasilianum TaxID=144538 RepID=A0A9N9AM49_9GLOM|nr:6517_t:CDS:2 [Paraglomus brasilianum]